MSGYVSHLRGLTDKERALFTPHPDAEATERTKRVLLATLAGIVEAVEAGHGVEADVAIGGLRGLLQEWNAARSGFEGAMGR